MGKRLGEARATRVYRDGISHIITEVHRSDVEADAFVFFRPKRDRVAMRRWIGEDAMLVPESGKATSERRQNAINTVFDLAYDKLLVLGVHCPAMTAAELKDAVVALETHDLVIGPTDDGGCYLIGMKQPHPELFADLSWSQKEFCAELTAAVSALGLSYTLLPRLHDFDSEEDLGYAWAMGFIQD
jgi:rSAM/selenodomain-associated transferase 1